MKRGGSGGRGGTPLRVPPSPKIKALIEDSVGGRAERRERCRDVREGPPAYDDFYHSVITSPDSAPGADGIPFSAYRVSPAISAQALTAHFTCILSQQVLPPVQTLVFIPKPDSGDYADNYRPLGLPNSSDRIIDRAAYAAFTLSLIGALHPAQALLNLFREPQANYLEVQDGETGGVRGNLQTWIP